MNLRYLNYGIFLDVDANISVTCYFFCLGISITFSILILRHLWLSLEHKLL